MNFQRNAVLHGAEPVKAAVFLLLGRRVVHFRGRRSRARGEDKGKQRVIAHVFDQADRVLEFLLRLAGEADDHVAGQNQLGHDLAAIVRQLQIFLAVIVPVHGLQHPVVAGLEGQVELLGDPGVFRNGIKEFFACVLRVARHEAQPEVSRQLCDLGHEVGKINAQPQILAVGVDVLAQKRNVLIARRDEALDFFENLLGPSRALPPAHIRHDAVRAEIVAAVHDRHPRLEIGRAHDGDTLGDIARGIVHGKNALVRAQHALQQFREAP